MKELNLFANKCHQLADVRFTDRKEISSLYSACFVTAETAKRAVASSQKLLNEVEALFRCSTAVTKAKNEAEFKASQAELQHAVAVCLNWWNS